MCFGHQYQCIVCVWLLFIQQACLPHPDHGWPVCYPMGLGIGGSISKGLGPLQAHSANSCSGKRNILQGLCFEEMKVFHGFSRAFMWFQGLSWSSTGFKGFHSFVPLKSEVLDGFYSWTLSLNVVFGCT